MRLVARVVAPAALAVGVTALPACTIGGPAEPSLADCRTVRLTVDPVRGATADDVVLRARLTVDGAPLPGQTVVLRVRRSPDHPILWSLGGDTAPDGSIAVDFADAIRRLRIARQAFDESRIVEAVFENPAARERAPRPGYCSTTAVAPFEPKR